MIFALYLLFVVPNAHLITVNKIYIRVEQAVIMILIATAYIAPNVVLPTNVTQSNSILQGFFVLWTCLAFFALVYARHQASVFYASMNNDVRITLFRVPVIMWPLVGLVLFNSMTSYLGLKTHTNLSMFSNLQTENHISNHYFIKQNLKLFNFQDDLVQVISTDVDDLKHYQANNDRLLITYFEFRRIVGHQSNDFYVEFWRNGTRQYLKVANGRANYPEFVQPPHWLLAKLMSFRPVYLNHSPCQW